MVSTAGRGRAARLTISPSHALTVLHRPTVSLSHQVELPGFDADAATVYCSNLGEAHVLQATASALHSHPDPHPNPNPNPNPNSSPNSSSNPTPNVLQATASALRLVAVEGMALLHEWRAPDGHQISMACCDAEHVLLATTGKQLFLFQLQEVTTRTLTLTLTL